MAEYRGAPITEPPAVSNDRWIKRSIYRTVRAVGVFQAMQWFTRRELRILCYHGISDTDLNRFEPFTFMSSQTFRNRMRYLKESGYRVIDLEEALKERSEGRLDQTVVITFDDSFKSTLRNAVPILEEYGYPATIYLTTYYAVKKNPIFRLVVQYMFWKTPKTHIDISALKLPFSDVWSLESREEKKKILWSIIKHGEMQMSEDQRNELCDKLGEILRVPFGPIEQSGELSLMDQKEVTEASERGFNIQLHTHRHRFPSDIKEALSELEDNRKVLKSWLGREGKHFCYPSGIWKPSHIKILEEAGVKSAVTCMPGLNDQDTNPLLLRRILDGEHISQVEFEAEMSGTVDFLRRRILSR